MEYFNYIKNYFAGFLILLIIDLAWLMLFFGKKFGQMAYNIQGEAMTLKPVYGFIAYLLLGIGVTYFGINRVNKDEPIKSSIINGGLFGLVCYGIFDFTNLAIFKDYQLSTAIIDTLWGGFLCTVTTYLSHKFLVLSA